MAEFFDRRPARQLLNLTRKADILDHMAEFHLGRPSPLEHAPEVQRAHRDSHSAGTIRMPHEHTLPNHDDAGNPTDRLPDVIEHTDQQLGSAT